jgi:hypothetical protein
VSESKVYGKGLSKVGSSGYYIMGNFIVYRSNSIVGQYFSGETCGKVTTVKNEKDMGE